MQRARTRTAKLTAARPGGGAQRLGPPRAHSSRGGNPESQGQLGRAALSSCRRMTPLPPGPPAAPSRALSLQPPEERREPEGPCQLPSYRIWGPLGFPA